MSLFDNPTQAIGSIAFLSAFISCALAGHRSTSTLWKWLAAVYFLFVIELAIGWRHGLRAGINDVMRSSGLYSDRAIIQWALLIGMAMFVLLLVALYRISAKQFGPRVTNHHLAMAATALLSLLFAVEVISFHWTDALLYQKYGGVMVIGWIWAVLAFITAISALLATLKAKNKERV